MTKALELEISIFRSHKQCHFLKTHLINAQAKDTLFGEREKRMPTVPSADRFSNPLGERANQASHSKRSLSRRPETSLYLLPSDSLSVVFVMQPSAQSSDDVRSLMMMTGDVNGDGGATPIIYSCVKALALFARSAQCQVGQCALVTEEE